MSYFQFGMENPCHTETRMSITFYGYTRFLRAESDTDTGCLERMPQSGCTQRGQVPIITEALFYMDPPSAQNKYSTNNL